MYQEKKPLALLIEAARFGDEHKVRALLNQYTRSGSKSGCDHDYSWQCEEGEGCVDCRDRSGSTPLHYACENGHLNVVKVLVSEFNSDLSKRDIDGCTALLRAAWWGENDIVIALLRACKLSITDRDNKGWGVLHYACAGGCARTVQTLIQVYKADINVQNEDKASPLQVAITYGHLDAALCLISEFGCDLNVKDCKGQTALHYACKKSDLQLVRRLISDGRASTDTYDNQLKTPLSIAVDYNNFDVAFCLIIEFGCDPNVANERGETPLHYECKKGDLDRVCALVDCKADVNAHDKESNTPLHIAAREGQYKVALVLMKKFGCPNMENQLGQTPLHYACKRGDLDQVFALVDHKADVNARDKENNTPLHMAVREGQYKVALVLVKKFGCNPNMENQLGQTPLHYACKRGDLELVRTLVRDGRARTDTYDNQLKTPLSIAVDYNNFDVAFCLIVEFGCDPNVANKSGETSLHFACKKGDLDRIFALVDHKADVNACDKENSTPLHMAVREGQYKVALVLVKKFGCNPNMVDQLGQTPLHYACKRGNLELVRTLVHDGRARTDIYDNKMESPLEIAVSNNNFDVAFCLITEFGCDPNVASKSGETPLHFACKKGDLDRVCALVDHKADVNAHDEEDNTPLHTAAREGQHEVVLVLMKKFGCNPNMVNKRGQTPLHYACKRGDFDLVSDLVCHKADVDVCDKKMDTPLHVAAAEGQSEVALALVNKFGCSPNVVNQYGRTPLHYSCKKGDIDLVSALVCDHKADIDVHDKNMNTPLHVAAAEGQSEVALALVNKFGCNPNVVNQHGQTPLHFACEHGDLDLVHALMNKHKFDANVQDKEMNTPLHVAAKKGQKDIVLALIREYSFDPTTQGHLGRTPLHMASHAGHHETVQALLSFTSPLVTDKQGNTPLHIAARWGQLLSTQYLLSANAPILIRNNYGHTAINLAWGRCESLLDEYARANRQHIQADYERMSEHAKKRYSGSQYITRVFVLGNPGAGKSSFIESLKREGFFQSFSKVSESSVPPHTAGIIPSVHISSKYGRALFYDFAGDPEYYSSHAAIFESLASSKKGTNIFVIVVDLRENAITIETTLHYWFFFIQNQKFSKASFIVLGSHLDQSVEKNNCLDQFCVTMKNRIKHFKMDCRDPRSNQIAQLKNQIFTWVSESQRYEISSEARLLLGLLEKDFSAVTACPVQIVVSHIKASGVWLPVEPNPLYQILLELHEVGVLLLLGDCTKDTDYIILNVSKLTNEVHELLFSESALPKIKSRRKVQLKMAPLNIGILPETTITEILPPHITKECLVHLQYCQQISHNEVGLFPCIEKDDATSQSFLFFPALCSVDKSQVPWDESTDNSFSIGWLLQCTDLHDYFPPRFLHVLLLRLVYGFTLCPARLQTAHASPEHTSHRCTMWKKGVYWKMEEGVDCMVELVNGIVVLTKSSTDAEDDCVKVFTKVVSCVLEAKAEFCSSTKPESFLLDSSSEADYLNEDHLFAVSDVERALESPEGKRVIISVSGRGEMKLSKIHCMRNLTHWNNLFPIDFDTVLHALREIVKDVYDIGQSLGAPSYILQAIEADHPCDVRKRRRELVKWWMSSSQEDPPCWWFLVQALKRIDENVLAENIKQQHDDDIQLQEKMLSKETQALKPDKEFLRSLSGMVGSSWLSLAVSLALSEEEMKQLKGKIGLTQQELALKMLNMWASREEATYRQLCHRLKKISLFQCSI